MKINTPNPELMEKINLLSRFEAERLLSRMSKKLKKEFIREKLSTMDVLLIQIEREEDQLNEWREALNKIRKKDTG
jgi:hypothetical protein